MNRRFILLFFSISALLSLNALSAATINFTGGGDGLSWEDPANWDSGAVPTFKDDVVLDLTDNVILNQAGQTINSIVMSNQSMLTIMGTGSLIINQDSNNGVMVELVDDAELTINGALFVLNSPDDAIHTHDGSRITNNGIVTVANASCDGIELFNISQWFNNGNLILSDIACSGIELEGSSYFENNGQIDLDDMQSEGIEMDDSGDFFNYGSLSINDVGVGDGVCMQDAGNDFYNYGTMDISDISDNALEVEDGFFFNGPGATLNFFNIDHDAVEMQNSSLLDNLGTININILVDGTVDNGFDLLSNSIVRNFNIINIYQSSSMSPAIDLNSSSSLFRIEACGVVNITSPNEIEIASGATFLNEGVLASVFGGTNTNNGTIDNQNVINAPNGFTASPNAVTGPGTINLNGPVPTQSDCNINSGSIGCGGTTTYDASQQMYTQTADGCFYAGSYTSDELSYVFQELCGNGEIIARVAGFVGQGWAGVTMREDLSPGSRKIQLMLNQSQVARREVRVSPNGPAFPQQFPAYGHQWLRLVRNGNYFQGYISMNGINWTFVMNQYVPMPNCIQIGLVSTNYNQFNSSSTAMFDNVFFSSSPLATPDVEGLDIAFEEVTEYNFSVFPNPTDGAVTINLDAAMDQEVEINIMNSIGQQVKNLNVIPAETPRQEIDLSGLPNGLYYFDLIDASGKRHTEKIILNANH